MIAGVGGGDMTPSSYSAPDHLIELDEWDALPVDTSRRMELVEGVLLVSPRAPLRHQDVVVQLASALRAGLPSRWRALVNVEVVVDAGPTPTVRVPDVVVVPVSLVDDRARCDASEVVAAFEVLSPGTRGTDRVTKLSEYANAGIPFYAVVDPGPPVVLACLRLAAGAYQRVGEHSGRVRLDLGVAVVELRLDA